MEREALQIQARLKPGKAAIRYMLAAIVIWAAVLYSVLSPPPVHRSVRMVVTLSPCQP